MNDRARKCLFDVTEAARAVAVFVEGMDFTAFSQDDLIRSAVERKFEIIGEALHRLRDMDEDLFRKIESGYDIIGMRNRLIHGYDAVDEEIVWDTIQADLPGLIISVQSLFESS